MASLPESLPIDQVAGARPSDAAVQPTDLGFGQLAEDVRRVDVQQRRAQRLGIEAQAKMDRDTVAPQIADLQARVLDPYGAAAAAYTGEKPGFAADTVGKARQTVQDYVANADVSEGQRQQLQLIGDHLVAGLGTHAAEHEAQVRAKPIEEARVAADDGAIGQGLTNFTTDWAPKKQALFDDPTQDGFVRSVGQGFDESAQAAVAAMPERLQPALQIKLAALKAETVARAGEAAALGQDKKLFDGVVTQGDTAINTVRSNPLAYDDVTQHVLPQIVAAAPARFRDKLQEEFGGQAATSRVLALSDQGQFGQAIGELKDGRYDAVLKPQAKDALIARVEAAQKSGERDTFEGRTAALDVKARADAETYARGTTGTTSGGVSLDEIADKLGPGTAAEYAQRWKAADQSYAAVGGARDATVQDLQARASTPAPDPSTPNYAQALQDWQMHTQAAAEELKARASDAGGWAWSSRKPAGKGGGTEQAVGAQDRGDLLQQKWQAVTQAAPGPARSAAIADYQSNMLWSQEHAGIPKGQWEVLPQAQVANLAANALHAQPEQKSGAMLALADLVGGFGVHRALDGSTVSASGILQGQLKKAGMTPSDISALLDFNHQPLAMARYAAASNDPTLKKPAPKAEASQLANAVQAALKPWLDSARPLPGALALQQARIDRTTLIARELVEGHGMGAGQAAEAAAQDVTRGATFQGSIRVPQGAGVTPQALSAGTHFLMQDLVSNNGAMLAAPPGAGSAKDSQRLLAGQVQQNGRWVTSADDRGVQLMVPSPDGSWTPVADKWGRSVFASWDQVKRQPFQGAAGVRPNFFDHPPAGGLTDPAGKPVAAISKATAFSAISSAVLGKESGGVDGQVSPAGALGLMQVMPDTVKTYAPRLGLPVDLERARYDRGYNLAIGHAALQDMLDRYGSGAGIGLALAAYNAGPGRLEGYKDAQGQFHPGWLQTIGDPRKGEISLTEFVKRIPFGQTRDYVQTVLPRALAIAQRH